MVETEGRDVEEAVAAACRELGKRREEITYEIVEDRERGFLGLVKTRRVKIRAEAKEEVAGMVDEGMACAQNALKKIVGHITDGGDIEAREEGGKIYLDIKGVDTGVLIGRHGQTLDALQYIVGKIVGKKLGKKAIVVVDTEAYRGRRREKLRELALRMGEKAKISGKAMKLKPMNARDRRIVHLALKDDGEVETRSQGEGELKRIKISPKGKNSQGMFHVKHHSQ